MTTNKTMEERFDDTKYGWYYRDRASGFCFLREDEKKSFISQEIERAVREKRERLLNQPANNHDQEVRRQQRGELREKTEGVKMVLRIGDASTNNQIYIEGFNQAISDILSFLQEDNSNKE